MLLSWLGRSDSHRVSNRPWRGRCRYPRHRPAEALTVIHKSDLTQATLLTTPKPTENFRGNKSGLPAKPCATCGRTMVWRRKWRLTWDEVKYCSDACRKGFKSA
ncbi:MAG: DUF2256 domain-containing protein [Paracoccus sp.]|nr:DUF2256 domain-containing protein [Thermomonas sp.]MBP8932373.1 DUF2256 domain-containing protein [Paracoccus sp. (in: a-proteobacteria)]